MITWRLLEILLDCQMEVAWRYCWSSFESMERLSNVETRSRTEVESPHAFELMEKSAVEKFAGHPRELDAEKMKPVDYVHHC